MPTCPGWSVERLVGHVGRVYRWTAGWVTTGASPPGERPPGGEPVIEWTRAGLDQLVAALDEAEAERTQREAAAGGAEVTVPTWAGDQPPIFWPRRLAVETALHRWDAQAARGESEPVVAELALDAIDELFEVLLPLRGTGDLRGAGETLHLHATDVASGEGEWLVVLAPGGLAVEHAHAKGDVAVRGTASDLLLLLWNRIDAGRCEVFGDLSLVTRWRETVRL